MYGTGTAAWRPPRERKKEMGRCVRVREMGWCMGPQSVLNDL